MDEKRPARKLSDELMSQDSGMPEAKFEEFRMNLNKSIELLERRSSATQRAAMIATCVVVAIIVSILPLTYFRVADIPWVRFLWAATGQIALLTACVLTFLHWYRYRPRIRRAQIELQNATLDEIQRQLVELSRRLDKHGL